MQTDKSINWQLLNNSVPAGWTCDKCGAFVYIGDGHDCSLYRPPPRLDKFTDAQLLEELLRRIRER